MDNMTETDKALLLYLTEEAYARTTGAAPKPYNPGKYILQDTWIARKTEGIPFHKVSVQLYNMLRDEHDEYTKYWQRSCDAWMDWMEKYLAWRKEERRRLRHKNAAGENQHELGPREFTLTYSPAWYETDEDAQRSMEVAIEKLTRYYKNEIIEFHAIGEFTRDGRSHVHAWYHLDGGRKITDKNFKRAWRHWNPKRKLGKGFEGGHHQTIQRLSDFSGYTEKHLDEAWMNIHINNGSQEVNGTSPTPSDDSSQDSSQHSS